MTVQFASFDSFVDGGFWAELATRKLNIWQLDTSKQPLVGRYSNHDPVGVPCRHSVDYSSFADGSCQTADSVTYGYVITVNTLDEYRALDRKALLEEAAAALRQSISSGDVLREPHRFVPFLLTVYADLKKYHFYYWFAFPALLFPSTIRLAKPTCSLAEVDESNSGLLIAKELARMYKEASTVFWLKCEENNSATSTFPFSSLESVQCTTDLYLVFRDPSTHDNVPGWPLRNFLAVLSYYRPDFTCVNVIGWRQKYVDGTVDCSHSLLMRIQLENDVACPLQMSTRVVGWEKNNNGILSTRFVDMSRSMDPIKLAEESVELNLSLMRWRLVPEIDLGRMKRLKCLLFGAGTLGCNVARCLLGWGVRKITLIDNGRVSMSNPVRQSLFQFADAVAADRNKAVAAAEALKKIFPSVDASGIDMTVPMPGHIVSECDIQSVTEAVETIEQLVKEHDVIFMLVDTREGRWLPTLLSTVHNKIAIGAALGFNSYVVIRHGSRSEPQAVAAASSAPHNSNVRIIPGHLLGCYFCSDVTAPGNSTQDRTLDQQCTVSRPGVSMIAAGLAVELLSSLVQHHSGVDAPAVLTADRDSLLGSGSDDDESCLGVVPHQIRGYCSRFSQLTPCVRRFDCCIACSAPVISEYARRGMRFLLDVFNTPGTLETLTGLSQLQSATDDIELWEFDDNESITSMETKE